MAAPDHSDAWAVAIAAVARHMARPKLAEGTRLDALDRHARLVLSLAARPTSQPHVLAALLRGPATVAELAEHLGWTINRVGRDLRALLSDRLVVRERRKPHHRSRARLGQPDVWWIAAR
jgi:DNA-binding transcriptional ArsR family regulator